jgi:ParB family transcriptional regulator, chromosome partitioning protein
MLTTKRYEYMPFDNIQTHPFISNHRPLMKDKIAHYERDILINGLLEPLIVWERTKGEYYLVGGFHRLASIKAIREKHPKYFDHVDVRVVSGDLDEMRALNLKLNADRLDTKITDYFDTVLYLNNANWSKERIAAFLDRGVTWIEEIIRFVPSMDSRLKKMLEEGKVSWNRAKGICRKILAALPEKEKEVADKLIGELSNSDAKTRRKKRPLTPLKAIKRLTKEFEKQPTTRYSVDLEDLLSLFMVLDGKDCTETHLERVRKTFPGLME